MTFLHGLYKIIFKKQSLLGGTELSSVRARRGNTGNKNTRKKTIALTEISAMEKRRVVMKPFVKLTGFKPRSF